MHTWPEIGNTDFIRLLERTPHTRQPWAGGVLYSDADGLFGFARHDGRQFVHPDVRIRFS